MAQTYNILIDQGSTYTFSVTYKDDTGNTIDLSNYTAQLQVREKYTSTSANINLTSSPLNGIEVGGSDGVIDVVFQPGDTQSLERVRKAYVYDLEITSPLSVVTRLIEGNFIVTPEVTR